MPVLRVDDEVWAWLKAHAVPFEDTPNKVMRRIAGLSEATDGSVRPTPNQANEAVVSGMDKKTPQRGFRVPILLILLNKNGKAERGFVLKTLARMLQGVLTDFDRKDIKSGAVRWQKTAEWELSTMRQNGLIVPQANSPRGVWCLTPEGEKIAREELAKASKQI
jgi:hypothetical protein